MISYTWNNCTTNKNGSAWEKSSKVSSNDAFRVSGKKTVVTYFVHSSATYSPVVVYKSVNDL